MYIKLFTASHAALNWSSYFMFKVMLCRKLLLWRYIWSS